MFNLFSENGIILNFTQQEKLLKFKELLIFYNSQFNLTSIKTDEEVLIKHFYDSLYGIKYFDKNKTVVEIGSGGGFPSIPIMIARDDLKFTLIESTGKKCEYLKKVIKELNLNATVLNIRAEDGGKNNLYREKFDYCTARAVARLNTLLEYCLPFIKVGGSFIAYKGEAEEEILECDNALKVLGGKLKITEKYNLPLEMGKRTIFVINKESNTPIKYPRGNGKERSKPL